MAERFASEPGQLNEFAFGVNAYSKYGCQFEVQVVEAWVQPQKNCSSRHNDFGEDLVNPGNNIPFPGFSFLKFIREVWISNVENGINHEL